MKSYALICAYNEESTANEVIRNTLKYVDKDVFVNDGSKDKTFELAKKKFGNNKKVIIISYPRNRGKGYAMEKGLERFSKEKGDRDILVTLDADKQHEPKEIPNVQEPVQKREVDIVIGTKRPGQSQPILRTFLAKCSSYMLYLSTGGLKVEDVSSGFRCYSKKAVRAILPLLKTEDYGIELEILQAAKKKNLKIKEVPISCNYKHGKKDNLPKIASGYLKFGIKHRNEIFKNTFYLLKRRFNLI
jgi:glycosyltransferase involved in cell wall biosynthesis